MEFKAITVGQVLEAAATGKLSPDSSVDQCILSNADAHKKRETPPGVKLNMSAAVVARIHELIEPAQVAVVKPEGGATEPGAVSEETTTETEPPEGLQANSAEASEASDSDASAAA